MLKGMIGRNVDLLSFAGGIQLSTKLEYPYEFSSDKQGCFVCLLRAQVEF